MSYGRPHSKIFNPGKVKATYISYIRERKTPVQHTRFWKKPKLT